MVIAIGSFLYPPFHCVSFVSLSNSNLSSFPSHILHSLSSLTLCSLVIYLLFVCSVRCRLLSTMSSSLRLSAFGIPFRLCVSLGLFISLLLRVLIQVFVLYDYCSFLPRVSLAPSTGVHLSFLSSLRPPLITLSFVYFISASILFIC